MSIRPLIALLREMHGGGGGGGGGGGFHGGAAGHGGGGFHGHDHGHARVGVGWWGPGAYYPCPPGYTWNKKRQTCVAVEHKFTVKDAEKLIKD